MKRKPSLAEIYAAEVKLSQSMQHTQASVERVQVAARASVARVTAVSLLVGAAAYSLMWLAHRRSRARAAAAGSAHIARNTSVLGLVLAYLLRYGRIGMPFILQHIRARRALNPAAKRASIPKLLSHVYPASGLRH